MEVVRIGVRTSGEGRSGASAISLASQAPCDLGHEVFRQLQVIEGLLEGLGGLLCLAAITFEVLPRFETAALSGFGMLFSVSF